MSANLFTNLRIYIIVTVLLKTSTVKGARMSHAVIEESFFKRKSTRKAGRIIVWVVANLACNLFILGVLYFLIWVLSLALSLQLGVEIIARAHATLSDAELGALAVDNAYTSANLGAFMIVVLTFAMGSARHSLPFFRDKQFEAWAFGYEFEPSENKEEPQQVLKSATSK